MNINSSFRYLVISALLVGALFVLSFVTGQNHYYLVGLSLATLIAPLLALALRANEDVFSPLYLVAYMLFFSVFLKTIYLTFLGSAYAKFVSLDSRSLDILEPGLLTTLLGVGCLSIGYLLAAKKKVESPPTLSVKNELALVNWSQLKVVMVGSLVIALMFNILFISEMNILGDILQGKISVKRTHIGTAGVSSRGSALTYLRWGAQTLPQVVLVVSIFLYQICNRKMTVGTKILLWILFFLSALIPIVTSARLELAYTAVLLLMAFHYGRKKIKLKTVVVTGIALIFAISILGLVRHSQTSGRTDSFSIEAAFDKTLGSGYFMDIAKTSVVVDSVPDKVDYLMGKSFGLIFIAPIPRALWPEKPVVRISKFVGEEIYTRPDDSGIPPGFIGESYLNFGVFGVVGLLALLGVGLSKLYSSQVIFTKTIFSRIWYIFGSVLLTLTFLSGDFTILISQGVRFGLVIWIVEKFVVVRKNGSYR